MQGMTKGAVYIATGRDYIERAVRSAESLKQYMPGIPITLFSDGGESAGVFDCRAMITSSSAKMRDKIVHMPSSPYDLTLYLDADTYVAGDLSELFDLLDRFDIAAAHAPSRGAYAVSGVPASFPEFNAGVVLFKRSSKTRQFFSKWLELYDQGSSVPPPAAIPGRKTAERYPFRDQPSFREALYSSELRIATLTPEYNCRTDYLGFVSGPVKILHGKDSRLSEFAEAINHKIRQRLHILRKGRFQVMNRGKWYRDVAPCGGSLRRLLSGFRKR